MEQLHRSEFLERSIDFRLERFTRSTAGTRPSATVTAGSPALLAVRDGYCGGAAPESDRTVRVEANAEGGRVQIVIAHTGPRFDNPDRAFDPFVPTQSGGETAGLGLSLCATILRDNRGRASAMNLNPQGAAIVLDLEKA